MIGSISISTSTCILHRLILSSIQISLSVATDPTAQSSSLWRFSETVTDKQMELRIESGFLVPVKSQSHFLNRPSQGLNFGNSDGSRPRFYQIFSSADHLFVETSKL